MLFITQHVAYITCRISIRGYITVTVASTDRGHIRRRRRPGDIVVTAARHCSWAIDDVTTSTADIGRGTVDGSVVYSLQPACEACPQLI